MANAINSLNYGNNTYTFTLPYGTCSTSATTAAKAVTVDNFSLETGARVAVKFTVTNTASSPTLNVNSTGAKAIYYKGAAITAGYLAANKVYEFIYNGTQWDLVGDSVTTADGSTAGITVVYPAASCTTFSSDSGTVTPLAVQKGAELFAITRPPKRNTSNPANPGAPGTCTTNNIVRWLNTAGDVQDSKIKIEDVTNTRDTSKKAQVIAIPAEGGKKMVYGYCTDQVDGTSFIGGVFDADATSYPYAQGLAIGGTSGNLLWKGNKVIDAGCIGDYANKTTVDSSLSSTSTNPVQNKVINSALAGKLSTTDTAAKATADANGNNIADTYATKAGDLAGCWISFTDENGNPTDEPYIHWNEEV